ncbi:hypothetical protein ACVXG9_17705 [Escherichia coli]
MIDLTAPKTIEIRRDAILAVSLANAKAAAAAKGMPLYEHIAELNGTRQILYAGSDDEHHQRW